MQLLCTNSLKVALPVIMRRHHYIQLLVVCIFHCTLHVTDQLIIVSAETGDNQTPRTKPVYGFVLDPALWVG